MGEVVRLEDRRRINEEAAIWLSRIDRGLSDAQRLELDGWLAQTPRHVDAFIELARAWDKLEGLNALSGLIELPVASNKDRGKRLGAAAVLIGGVLLGLAMWSALGRIDLDGRSLADGTTSLPENGISQLSNGAVRYTTQPGEVRRVTLTDGTAVSLNTRSNLVVAYSKEQRTVDLQSGEATFDVTRDTERPFIVKAAGKTIKAVGTVFTVRAKSNDSVSVIVSEGRVAVSEAVEKPENIDEPALMQNDTPRLLEAGDRLELVSSQAFVRRLSASDIDDALAWRNGMIVFQEASLEEALREVSRYSSVRFELADVSLGEMKIAGVYQIKDLVGFVESLRINLGVEVRTLPDGTVLLYRLNHEKDKLDKSARSLEPRGA